jgi:hypothetical protein
MTILTRGIKSKIIHQTGFLEIRIGNTSKFMIGIQASQAFSVLVFLAILVRQMA